MRKKDLLAALVAGGFMLVPMMVQADEIAPADTGAAISQTSDGSTSIGTADTSGTTTVPTSSSDENSGQSTTGTEDGTGGATTTDGTSHKGETNDPDQSGTSTPAENSDNGTTDAGNGSGDTDTTNQTSEKGATTDDPANNAGVENNAPSSDPIEGVTTTPSTSEKNVKIAETSFLASSDYSNEDGSVVWSAADKTLTLTNANIGLNTVLPDQGAMISFNEFDSEDTITVNVKGNNTIEPFATDENMKGIFYTNSNVNFVGEGDSTLVITGLTEEWEEYVIAANNVNISNVVMDIYGVGWGVLAEQDCTITDSVIDLFSFNDKVTGMYAENITLQNASINIGQDTSGNTDPIFKTDRDFTANNSSIIMESCGKRLVYSSKNVILNNMYIYADSVSEYGVIYGYAGVEINDSYITLNISESENKNERIGAIRSNENIIIKGEECDLRISSPNYPALSVYKSRSIFSEDVEIDVPYILFDGRSIYLNEGLETDIPAVKVTLEFIKSHNMEYPIPNVDYNQFLPYIQLGENVVAESTETSEELKTAATDWIYTYWPTAEFYIEVAEKSVMFTTADADEPISAEEGYSGGIHVYKQSQSADNSADYSAYNAAVIPYSVYQKLYTDESVAKVEAALARLNKAFLSNNHEEEDQLIHDAVEALNALEFKNPQTAIVENDEETQSLIEKAVKEKSDTVVLDKKENTLENLVIAVNLIENVYDAGLNLEIQAKDMNITFDSKTLSAFYDAYINEFREVQNATEYIILSVREVDLDDLSDEQKASLKDANAYKVIDASITFSQNGITNFNGGKVILSIPVSSFTKENSSAYKLVYVAEDGTLQELTSKCTDGYVKADLEHFSIYAVVDDTVVAITNNEVGSTDKVADKSNSKNTSTKTSSITTTAASTSTSTSGVNTAASFGAGQYLAGLLLGAAGIFKSKKRRKEN